MSKKYITSITEKINNETGEIIESEKTKIIATPATPDFTMIFTQDIGFIANISPGATKLLFGLLSIVNRRNEINLNKSLKDEIAVAVGLKKTSINVILTQLVNKQVILQTRDDDGKIKRGNYLLNPFYFGKGRWQDISKLRVMIEYDFNTHKKIVAYEQIHHVNVSELDMMEQRLSEFVNIEHPNQSQLEF